MAFFYTNPIALIVLSLLGINYESRRAALLWVLAIATEKQLPLANALDALAGESDGVWRNNIEDFAAMIQDGTPMAEAAASVPGLLSDESIMAIRAAAESGTLVTALRSEAERVSLQQELSNRKIIQTVVYITAVATLAMLIVSFIMIYIIPKFKKIFEDFGVEVPAITTSLIDISDFVLNFWLSLIHI